ncbi:hypothetical protein [Methylobacterium sp. E-046]|uniref:hypothetical protein n=1 Tax=Methylobacterium sp. E-046 TaxID=2836576 RepID=UPI001FBB95F5|nr:hypothetical protein [Methylobacterium sp. E-046]MCJ2098974.1 hypothetical protein [Methylobacterium sp. E-046]
MTHTSDHLGRVWAHDKLDHLLSDPEVVATVETMDRAARWHGGEFELSRARGWARAQGRSEAGLALLVMLWWRRLDSQLGMTA